MVSSNVSSYLRECLNLLMYVSIAHLFDSGAIEIVVVTGFVLLLFCSCCSFR